MGWVDKMFVEMGIRPPPQAEGPPWRGAPLIDLSEGPCLICVKHKTGHCDCCGREIPIYPEMFGNGYQSPAFTHQHLQQVGGQLGKAAIWAELCLECYRISWQEVYPGQPVPV